ncbi:alpha/beta hydrolase [Lentilitoribacter sp. Alg239-R112]|jgi:lysophospholipase|uniref:alpha/beta fold hydrolase n=1 Tax=Lentilitoribacter sp. Alg239-R112 TaxID=2305987 RepID=UPI0013A70A6E|nr:alpha/beta hydrolase [Lentilitoribacter sp. Alg239-R112]
MDSILFSTPNNELPEDFKAGYFDGVGGVKLRYAFFRSSGQNAKGTIVLLQGRNECIEKYYETIRYFTNAGFWVATFDWRGQGGSERLLAGERRGFVQKFQDYQDDVKHFLDQVVLPDTRMPFFAVGHSMGGLVLLSIAPSIANRIDRIVLAAPFLGLTITGARRFFIGLGLKLANMFGFGKYALPRRENNQKSRFDRLTSSSERFMRNQGIYEAYPEFGTGPPTIRWLLQMMKVQKRVNDQSFLEPITVPTVILGATHDGVVPYHIMEDISTKFRAGQLIPFDGSRHEILQEVSIYREPALEAILAFFSSSDEVYSPMSMKKEKSETIE